jgi:signal transduction histidine kinase
LVKTESDEKERNVYLKLVEKSVNKLDTFISDLTNFSRNGRLEINITRIDFKSILRECLENLKYMENADRIKTIINIKENFDYFSDSTRISIIFQNIISNSIKYQNLRVENSFVKIDITTEKDHAEIKISDNGKGIKEEYLDKIFNMFFRASQESYGSGLGLYITKQVVEKLGGNIEVNSSLGFGTEFSISLPDLKK